MPDQEPVSYTKQHPTKNIFIIVGSSIILLILVAGAYFLFMNQRAEEQAQQVNQSQTEVVSKEDPHKDWGNITSELGFSLKYPYKEIGAIWGDDEYFQIGFVFPATLVTNDEKLSEQIYDNFGELTLAGAMISVTKDQTASANLESWIKTFLSKDDKSYGKKEFKVLSEVMNPITFAGINGYELTRYMERVNGSLSLRFTRKEVFIAKGELVYRFTHNDISGDTAFPIIGDVGKNYLEKINSISEEVFETFTFDGSKATAITVPKPEQPKLSGEAADRRQKLLTALRTKPFYDESKTYPTPSDPCDPGSTSKSSDPEGSLASAGGIYIGADDEVSSLHAYDESGRHTGLMPPIPGFENSFAPSEERAQSIDRIELGSIGYGLVMSGTINGRIELVGKGYATVNFEFRGDGNGCTITEVLAPVTPYSVGTVPLTVQGDIGPISYDIDGDGTEDFVLSLVHPLFPTKQLQLDAVIADMQATK